MKILCTIPPIIPSYFNAGHHLPIFQVGAYLRKLEGAHEVVCVDASALNYTWKDICSLLLQQFDVIILMNDFDGIDTFDRIVHYIRKLSPHSKLLTFGRLSKQIPEFFHRYNFDAILCSGDYEAGAGAYIKHLQGLQNNPPGISLKTGQSYTKPIPGLFLLPEEWGVPNVAEIPYSAYSRMYINDLNKFCGIPERHELVVQVARGCPVGCSFCDVPIMQGKKERRLPVPLVIAYIEDAFNQQPLEYVSFYAPTFTLDKRWVYELCQDLINKGRPYYWKCVTTIHHLNTDLIEKMAAAGCVRISVGLETLTARAYTELPKLKRSSEEAFLQIAESCNLNGIELNCFIILGLPGDTPHDVRHTFQIVERVGGRIRPTIYTPYGTMSASMSVQEVATYNRQVFIEGLVDPKTAHEYYALFHGWGSDRITQVMKKIPSRA